MTHRKKRFKRRGQSGLFWFIAHHFTLSSGRGGTAIAVGEVSIKD